MRSTPRLICTGEQIILTVTGQHSTVLKRLHNFLTKINLDGFRGDSWMSYDNERSVALKAEFAFDAGLAGVNQHSQYHQANISTYQSHLFFPTPLS